ncbi:MAG: YihY/virulence factor BrkB family protein [Nitrospirales bacterium]
MNRLALDLPEILSEFRHHGCVSLAASMAFFGLLSFFPLAFLMLYALSLVLHSAQAQHELLVNFFHIFIPHLGDELVEEIKRVSQEQVVRTVIFLTFVWFGALVFYEVEYAVNVVFETPHKRHPVMATLLSVAILGLAALLFLVSYALTQVLTLLVAYAPLLPGVEPFALGLHHFLLSYILPFLLVVFGVMCLYRYLPHRRPTWRDAWIGALVFGCLWELTKHLFTTYVQTLSVYGRMYGSLLVVILFLLWVYYSAVLFLLGAELVHRLQLQHPVARPALDTVQAAPPVDQSPPDRPLGTPAEAHAEAAPGAVSATPR